MSSTALEFSKSVDTDAINQPRSEKIRGVDFTVYFGPDDMPSGVHGQIELECGVFRVDFRYDSVNETPIRRRLDSGTVLRLGSKSGRVYGIEVSTCELNAECVAQLVLQSLRTLQESPQVFRISNTENYLAAERTFRQVQPEIESLFLSARS